MAHIEPPHLEIHWSPSSFWILNMIWLGINIFWKFADENFVVGFLVIKELMTWCPASVIFLLKFFFCYNQLEVCEILSSYLCHQIYILFRIMNMTWWEEFLQRLTIKLVSFRVWIELRAYQVDNGGTFKIVCGVLIMRFAIGYPEVDRRKMCLTFSFAEIDIKFNCHRRRKRGGGAAPPPQ